MTSKLQGSERTLLLLGVALCGFLLIAAALHSQYMVSLSGPEASALHVILELPSILLGFAVFVVNWESSKQNQNTQSLLLGSCFLTLAFLDTLHLINYEGMPGPSAAGMSVAGYYWVFARFWVAGLLLAVAFIDPKALGRPVWRGLLLAINLAFCALVAIYMTLYGSLLPPLDITGEGQTALKVALEWLAVCLCLLAAVPHLRMFRATGDEPSFLIVAALLTGAASGAAVGLLSGPGQLLHSLGHIYKAASYYLVFRAVTVTSVHRPYAQLRVAKEQLERAVAALDARNRELDALDEVAVALGATLRPEAILEAAIESVMKVTNAGAGAIFLLEEPGGELKLAAWRGLSASVVDDCSMHVLRMPASPLGGDASGQEHFSSNPMLVRRLGGSLARIAPLGACVCAPIVHKGRILGAIAMVSREGSILSAKDADLLTAIGYQFGLAIENARLYEQTDDRLREKMFELQRAERRSRLLYEVGALFASGMELGPVLDLVAKRSVEVVGDACSIYLLDDKEETLTLEAMHHRDEREFAPILELMRGRRVPVGEGFVGIVAQSGEPALQGQVSKEAIAAEVRQFAESVEEVAMLRRSTPTSRVAAPMRAHGRTVGVLSVFSANPWQPLGDMDLSLIEELAGRAGVAIENRRLLQETQEQRNHLEAIISQMVDGVVITDVDGNRVVVNGAAQRMLAGRGVESLHGIKRAGMPGATASRPWVRETPLVDRALSGELVVGEEVLGMGLAGEMVLSASASPVRDEVEAITGAVLVLRDVTAEREVARMKDEFVAVTSHELRTPITAVLGYTDILLRGLRGPLSAKQKEALESVRNAGSRLLALINDLLDMSRLEAGKQETTLAPVSVPAAVERALSAVSFQATLKGIVLRQTLPPDLPEVLADDEQLQRILANLLSNAVKFTPQGGSVTVSAGPLKPVSRNGITGGSGSDPNGREVAITVSDTGIGIAPEHQQRIWDKFQQVDSSSHRMFGGTGLGLAIAKALVELNGGRVWVESDGISGHGATFGFTLKVVGEQ